MVDTSENSGQMPDIKDMKAKWTKPLSHEQKVHQTAQEQWRAMTPEELRKEKVETETGLREQKSKLQQILDAAKPRPMRMAEIIVILIVSGLILFKIL